MMVPGLVRAGWDVEIATFDAHPDGLAERFEAAGARVRVLPVRGLLSRAKALQTLLDGRAYDIVHSALFQADIASRVACLGQPVAHVTTLANVSYGADQVRHFALAPLKLRAALQLDRITARWTTRFHAVAEHVARDMGPRLGIEPRRMTVVPRGRRPEALGRRTTARTDAVRQRMGVETDTRVILGVGRLAVQKNLVTLVRAVARLRVTLPDVQLWLAGRPGDAETAVREVIAQHDLSEHVRILGARDDVPELMCAADVLGFPSLWEGMPGTLIEAMALELPIVATRIDPVLEVAGEHVVWLFPTEDHDAMAEQLAHVLTTPTEASQRTTVGRRRFETDYTIEAACSGIDWLYRQALADVRTAPRPGSRP